MDKISILEFISIMNKEILSFLIEFKEMFSQFALQSIRTIIFFARMRLPELLDQTLMFERIHLDMKKETDGLLKLLA